MDIQILVIINSLFSIIGVGSLIGILITSHLNEKSRLNEKNFELKEKRYKANIILMWAYINPKKELHFLQKYRNDIKDIGVLRRELILELYEMLLYADDKVIKIFKKCIDTPSYENYSKVIVEMRKDLYGKSTKIKFEDIEPDNLTIRILKT